MEQIFIELALKTPIAAVAIFSIWRMSLVMETLAKSLVSIADAQNNSLASVIAHEIEQDEV